MLEYYLKKATISDLDIAMNIINEAKEFLKSQNIDQWQTGYPNKQIILEDIKNERGYLLTSNNLAVAYACIDFDGEPAYTSLKGKWNANTPYIVIHRMAISAKHKGCGLSHIFFNLIEQLCVQQNLNCIRVDTDEDNLIMRHILSKNDFKYCGTIIFDNSTKYAYDKII